ncbi:Phosphoglycerate dehydrogenase [Paracidovorax avenae ATCC 19860]|uniref:D-3-phosphoglycerate dehydrogenase n=1 Tax=Paracidovorax avenae (strain ATCC 19860 / DSM 7227 / CCUG 15838 / JCM 20985 / LMG 2117 / NCPPB 1011) TaxID=643561 RepID=F0QCI4_PARA1|nr:MULTISPECIES: phosphoglycerate dehydrogenase [Comamonadaceae]ADX47467.1 Phosphoglycerate dehydrogenase [Paracidovorax avenae ATCC 19860]AVS66333.1 phosphoglycerate dehydrogenase [Paracidovorax avenae]MDA8452253.1 phosphoglycerate dehydrogenase [Acidovorax sp. GBBC 3297]MDA8461699.1 phosphoglycerate dehydrogenase [Acidovorax sp. GBBC 3333]MDA8466726.1 phosphoglycerate dehydrogenase [Acidovorax sp. GBBC 3332]
MTKTSLDKSKIKFLLLEGVHPSALDVLRGAGYTQIEALPGALEGEELHRKIADAHFLGIRSRTQLTAEVFAHAHKLVAVGAFCIGTNQIDLDAARERGIAVFNAPYSNTRSVAELVLAEAILLLRGVPEKNAVAHRGGWLKSAENAYEIRGKTLGIVGYGSIGTQLSVLAEALGMHVVFHDVVSKLPLGNARQAPSLQALLAQSDIVTLHVPELPSTQWMIGPEEIAAMKPGAILINAARGTVVRIEALAEAIRAKKLLGAAIDVFPVEPRSNKDEFTSPLRGLDNVILTPHIGGSTMEAQANIGLEVAEKLVKYSDNGTSTSSVNFPEVALPAHPGKHRILHIHRNVPGVLSAINQVFADNQINIAAQYLQTNEKVGYVVIDIDAQSSELAQDKLASVPGTIRSRVLF